MNEEPKELFVPLTAEIEKKRRKLDKLSKIVVLYALFQWVWYIYEMYHYSPSAAPAYAWVEAMGISGILYGIIV